MIIYTYVNRYHFIEWLIPGAEVVNVAEKVFCDVFLYSPVWYVWFLASMTLLEKKGVDMVLPTVRQKWLELTLRSTAFYLPLAIFMYGLVPLEARTFVLSVCNVVYVCGLSLWRASTTEDD